MNAVSLCQVMRLMNVSLTLARQAHVVFRFFGAICFVPAAGRFFGPPPALLMSVLLTEVTGGSIRAELSALFLSARNLAVDLCVCAVCVVSVCVMCMSL